MKKIIPILSVLMLGAIFCHPSFASPGIIAAKFHADWCGSCKAIAPTYEQVMNQFKGEDVLFVTLDKTDDVTSNQAELMAHALGIEEAYVANQETGFILLIQGTSKEVVGKLTKSQSFEEMEKIVERVLAGEDVFSNMDSSREGMKGGGQGSMKGSQKGS